MVRSASCRFQWWRLPKTTATRRSTSSRTPIAHLQAARTAHAAVKQATTFRNGISTRTLSDYVWTRNGSLLSRHITSLTALFTHTDTVGVALWRGVLATIDCNCERWRTHRTNGVARPYWGSGSCFRSARLVIVLIVASSGYQRSNVLSTASWSKFWSQHVMSPRRLCSVVPLLVIR